jgi:hypothetical protein
MWVGNFFSNLNGKKYIEGVSEKGAEENTCT